MIGNTTVKLPYIYYSLKKLNLGDLVKGFFSFQCLLAPTLTAKIILVFSLEHAEKHRESLHSQASLRPPADKC